MAYKELWQCPKCGAKFVTPNMWHSCGVHSLEELFARSDPHVLPLFNRFVELVQSVGPVTVIPQKTRVVMMVRVRFAGAMPRKSHFIASFGFARRRESPRFYKIEQYAPHWYGHYTRVASEADFDEEFMDWIRESYAVGEQKHLNSTNFD
jgi:hypothetical protein